jgi:hypothetical protein
MMFVMPQAGSGEIISEILTGCDTLADNPPLVNDVEDRYIPMCMYAIRDSLLLLPEAQKQLSYVINARSIEVPFTANLALNHILRSIQEKSMSDPEDPEKPNPLYPYETQEEWNKQVFGLLSDEKSCKDIANNMLLWHVGSDVEDRIAGAILVAQTMQADRANNAEKPFNLLSVGSARDHAVAMLSGDIAMSEVEVVGDGFDAEKRRFFQERVNELLAREIVLGDSYGVDMWPLNDPEWSRFLEACRYYPSELRDPVKRSRYKQLEGIRDADKRLHHADIDYSKVLFDIDYSYLDNTDIYADTDYTHVDLGWYKEMLRMPEWLRTTEIADLVLLSTSLYQSYREKQRVIFDIARRHVKFGGKIVVQDFCEIVEIDEGQHPIDRLKFLGPSSKPYTYGTFVYDTLEPELGFQVFGWWNNGRCEKFMPGELFLKHATQGNSLDRN